MHSRKLNPGIARQCQRDQGAINYISGNQMLSADRGIVQEMADAQRTRPPKANDCPQCRERILWPMLTPCEYGTPSALPEECEEVYCWAEPPMKDSDREEVKKLIAESQKGFA